MSDSDQNEKRSYKPYTTEEIVKITMLYESGDYTIKEIADMLERGEPSIRQKIKDLDIVKGAGREKNIKEVKERLEREESKDVAVRVQRALETKDDHYKYARDISKLLMSEIVEANKEARQLGEKFAFQKRKGNIQMLKTALEGLSLGQEQRNIALGLDKADIISEEDLPELGILEMTEDEVLEVQAKAEDSMLDDTDVLDSSDTNTQVDAKSRSESDTDATADDPDALLEVIEQDLQNQFGGGNDG